MNADRYNESPEKTTEFFRLVITMLGEYKLVPNPINFTLCFEYVSGSNSKLNEALDDLLEAGFTDKEGFELFRKFIWDADRYVVDELRTELSTLIMNTFNSVGHAQSEAQISVENIEKHSKRLRGNPSLENMQSILADVVNETRQVAENGNTLKGMLDDTKNEVETLRLELEQTRKEATTDPLTGLKNRRSFEVIMQDSMVNVDKFDESLCLVMADIDHFKKINDNYGHIFGDKVLKSVSSLLLANVKGKDSVARLGGEEFAILLPETSLEFAGIVAENLRFAIESARIKTIKTGKTLDKLTVSMGVTTYHKGESTEEFIDRADKALYESKNSGRNRITAQS